MSKRPKKRKSLEEILKSTSDSLFPDKMGNKKVKVNSKDCTGDTPLHIMTLRSDRYAVDILIENGADVNAVGDMTETPLHVAIRKGDLYIVEALLNAGSKIDIRSEFNETSAEKAKKTGGEIEKLFNQYTHT